MIPYWGVSAAFGFFSAFCFWWRLNHCFPHHVRKDRQGPTGRNSSFELSIYSMWIRDTDKLLSCQTKLGKRFTWHGPFKEWLQISPSLLYITVSSWPLCQREPIFSRPRKQGSVTIDTHFCLKRNLSSNFHCEADVFASMQNFVLPLLHMYVTVTYFQFTKLSCAYY